MAPPTIDALFLAFQQAIAGRYSLERELGRGGMGVVYLAHEVRLDRLVAIKLLPPEFARQPTLRGRFMREAHLAARLSHPNIVPIHNVDEGGDFVFYVMAYVNGETLSDRVRSRGPLPAPEVSRILREVAWALAYAHAQGIVHRDVKPANILLETGTNRALVTDFGIARLANVPGETAAGELLGTPEYMSPEQACGEQLDGRSDLYSLGIVGYFATTGTLPFTGEARKVLSQQVTKAAPLVASVARSAPRSLASAIDRCLMKEAAARFATGEELAEALSQDLAHSSEIPVALRVFLDRRQMAALVGPIAIGAMIMPVVIQLMSPQGVDPFVRASVGVALAAVFFGGPLAMLRERMRKMMRQGFGVEDVAGAIRTMAKRKQEEFLYEFGAERSTREKFLLGFGLACAGTLAATAAHSWLAVRPLEGAGAIALLSGYGSVLGLVISLRWHRIRTGKEPLLAKFWRGPIGRMLERFSGYKLGPRAIPADRPTELGIAVSAEALYAELPKEVRKSVGDVPSVLKSLESQARAIRARIAALDDSLTHAQRGTSGFAATGEIKSQLLHDLKAARAQAESRLADLVTALETLRLNLIRLRAGATGTESITQDLAAAQSLSEDVERLLGGLRDVETALSTQKKL